GRDTGRRRLGRGPYRRRAARAARPDGLGTDGWSRAARPVGVAGLARGRLPRLDEVGRVSAVSKPDVSASVTASASVPAPERGTFRGVSDLGLVARQVGF